MATLVRFLQSTILSKVVMAVTGLLLVLFLVGHMVGNMQMYLGPEKMNTYAHTLQSLGGLLWAIRCVLLLFLVLHVWTSIRLKLLNNAARPVPYAFKATVRATLASRTMIWSGIMIFLFLTYHLLHFTVRATNPVYASLVDAAGNPDVYSMVILGYQNVLISLVYIAAIILLGFHLYHAIGSMFQTLGISHEKYDAAINGLSIVLSLIIVVGFISIPFGVLVGLIGLPAGVVAL